jgi:hypothetical protein
LNNKNPTISDVQVEKLLINAHSRARFDKKNYAKERQKLMHVQKEQFLRMAANVKTINSIDLNDIFDLYQLKCVDGQIEYSA